MWQGVAGWGWPHLLCSDEVDMKTLADYRKIPHWSYSQLNQFFNICSLQYAFQRVYKLEPAFVSVNLSFGSAFHRVLEWVAHNRMEGRSLVAKDVVELWRELWQRQVAEEGEIRCGEGETVESYAEQGALMVACAVENINPDEEVVSVGEPFCVPLQLSTGKVVKKPLIGEIDLVVQKDGRTTLVDWKTSRSRWPKGKAAKDWQATAFVGGYACKHGVVPVFRYDVVVKNKKPVFESHETVRGEQDFQRLAYFAQMAERLIEAEHFCPNEQGFYCGGCPYQEPCRNWHRARAVTRVAAA